MKVLTTGMPWRRENSRSSPEAPPRIRSPLAVAMRAGGGAAFRKEVGIERPFRDARAGAVMAPTSDALRDFIGRALCGLPLFG